MCVQREAIDPFQYSHRCDNSATYVPKRKTTRLEQWQKVSDTTGRGFGDVVRQMPGAVSNTYHGYREEMPRPTMATLTTQNPKSLDAANRFFEDNKRRMQAIAMYDMAQERPQYSDKKQLATKVTNREFI